MKTSPGFALVTIATLAVGIAAATIVYSLVDGILLRPLPVDDPGRVVLARELTPRRYQISPYDLTTLSAITATLLLVATLACHVPARRATQVDPMIALRTE